MIQIIGFDPSKYTGWALYSPEQRKADGNFSHVQCGVLEMPEKADIGRKRGLPASKEFN